MSHLNAYTNDVNQKVTGEVKVKLYKGRAEVQALETPNSVFSEKLVTFMASSDFNQNAAPGFTELYTLQMRMAQRSEKTALLSIGKRENKQKLRKEMKMLADAQFKLYATYKTHKLLKREGIEAILVHKISKVNNQPNLLDLLEANRFDLIINIPTDAEKEERTEKEQTDGQVIRKFAIKNNTLLATDVGVAKKIIEKIVRV
jgi:argininosuccinate synthase